MERPTRILMGAAAGAALGWIAAQRGVGRGLYDQWRDQTTAPSTSPSTATPSGRTLEQQLVDAAMESAVDRLKPLPSTPDEPDPTGPIEDPFDYLDAGPPPTSTPMIDDPHVDPWFRPIDLVAEIPESVMDPDITWLTDDGPAQFMLPDGTYVDAETYLNETES